MAVWNDRTFINRDGIALYYRDYDGPSDRPPIVCLHGLTRNSRDFESIAARLAGSWRVLAHDFRGRGNSGWDDQPQRYAPPVYAHDVVELLDHAGAGEAIFLGTSLGGIVTMLVAATWPDRVAGAMLNDIGPDVDPAGIARIRTYVGQSLEFPGFEAAGAAFQAKYGDVHPAYGTADWVRFARRVCRERDGQVVLDYDMRIADNFNRQDSDPVGDLWPLIDGLKGKPVLILRGESSDLLTPETAQAMKARLDAEIVTVPGVGHAPDLDEPESVAAIQRLLDRVMERRAAPAG